MITALADAGGEAPQGLFLLVADDAVIVGAGPGIGLIGRTTIEDLAVGGGHMGVGADDQAGPPITKMTHGHLFGGGFGMHIDNGRITDLTQGAGIQLAVNRGEGVIEGVHMDPAQEVDDQNPVAAIGLKQL